MHFDHDMRVSVKELISVIIEAEDVLETRITESKVQKSNYELKMQQIDQDIQKMEVQERKNKNQFGLVKGSTVTLTVLNGSNLLSGGISYQTSGREYSFLKITLEQKTVQSNMVQISDNGYSTWDFTFDE